MDLFAGMVTHKRAPTPPPKAALLAAARRRAPDTSRCDWRGVDCRGEAVACTMLPCGDVVCVVFVCL